MDIHLTHAGYSGMDTDTRLKYRSVINLIDTFPFSLACVAAVFPPFRAGRGEETPAQMAIKKAFSSDKTSDLIPIGQSR